MLVTRKDARTPVEMVFTRCQGLGVQYEENQWWVLPISATGAQMNANRALWILPLDATSKDHSWHLELHGGDLSAKKTDNGTDGYCAGGERNSFQSGGSAAQRPLRPSILS